MLAAAIYRVRTKLSLGTRARTLSVHVERAADRPVRLGGRVRPQHRPPRVQNVLVRRGSRKHQPQQAHAECRSTQAHMHPCSSSVLAVAMDEPCASAQLIGVRWAHMRPPECILRAASCSASLPPYLLHLLLLDASSAARRRSIRARPWTLAVSATKCHGGLRRGIHPSRQTNLDLL